jgi:hypothetical protein
VADEQTAAIPEEQNPAALPEGVTQDGGTTRVVSEKAPEAPAADTTKAVGTPGLPEGFATVENEGKYKGPESEGDGTKITTEQTEAEEPKTGIDLQVSETLKRLGPEFGAKAEPFVRELATTGDMTPESITKAAETLGIPQSLVEQYVADRKSEAAAQGADEVAPVYELVGGADNFPGFQAWANEALGPEAHAKINAALGLGPDGETVTGKPDAAKLKEYTDAYAASGRAPAPRDVSAEGGAASSQSADVDVFKSIAEQNKAINSPKYRTDAAYRDKVVAKMQRSDL